MSEKVTINVDVKETKKTIHELVECLEKANSLADELADKLKHLEINIES